MEDKIFIKFDKIKSIFWLLTGFFSLTTLLTLLIFDDWLIKIGFLLTFLIIISSCWLVFFYYQKNYYNRPYLELKPEYLSIQAIRHSHIIAWQAIRDINQDDYGDFVQTDKKYAVSRFLLIRQRKATLQLLKNYTQKFGTLKFIY